MAKKKKALQIEEKSVKGLKELLKPSMDAVAKGLKAVPMTINPSEFDKHEVSEAIFEAKVATSRLEYHANGEITIHWI